MDELFRACLMNCAFQNLSRLSVKKFPGAAAGERLPLKTGRLPWRNVLRLEQNRIANLKRV